MNSVFSNLRSLRWGVLLALFSFVFGFGLGIVFGAAEDSIKGTLKDSGQAVLDTEYGGDPAKMKKVTDKAWVYFKRAHLHAGGMGAAALGMILLLACLPGTSLLKRLSAVLLGIGAVGYPIFWMLAGLRAPGLGGTGAAKETLTWLAWPSSGLFVIGLLMVLVFTMVAVFRSED